MASWLISLFAQLAKQVSSCVRPPAYTLPALSLTLSQVMSQDYHYMRKKGKWLYGPKAVSTEGV
jgi:hypothetical protein